MCALEKNLLTAWHKRLETGAIAAPIGGNWDIESGIFISVQTVGLGYLLHICFGDEIGPKQGKAAVIVRQQWKRATNRAARLQNRDWPDHTRRHAASDLSFHAVSGVGVCPD